MSLGNKAEDVTVPEKFGRVFSRGENGEYGLEEGLRFSNTKLRILKGETEDDAYNGQKYSFGLLNQRFKVPIPMGKNIQPDLQHVNAAYEKELEIAKKFRIINNDQEPEEYQKRCQLIRNAKTSLLWILCSPGYNILEQEFLLKVSPFTFIDDMLEIPGDSDDATGKESKKKMKLPYKLVCKMSHVLCDAIKAPEGSDGKDLLEDMAKSPSAVFKDFMSDDDTGGVSLMEEILEATDDNIGQFYGWINFLLAYLSHLRKESYQLSKKNGCSAKGVLDQSAQVMDVFCFQFSKEWYKLRNSVEDSDATLLPTVASLRRGTGAGMLFLECILLQNGIDLGDDVRGCALFKLIAEQFKIQIQNVNDIVSYSNDISGDGQEWKNNAACILHKAEGLSEIEAFGKLADEANRALDQIELLGELLLDLWKGTKKEKNVTGFIAAVKLFITGHIQWIALIQRYHKDITLDCYIN